MAAITFASLMIFFIKAYSLGWWQLSSRELQTTALKPLALRQAATVPPPIPIVEVSIPFTFFTADERRLTIFASLGVAGETSGSSY